MAQPHRQEETEAAVGMPGWVKGCVAVAVVLVVVLIILHLTGLSPMGHGG